MDVCLYIPISGTMSDARLLSNCLVRTESFAKISLQENINSICPLPVVPSTNLDPALPMFTEVNYKGGCGCGRVRRG